MLYFSIILRAYINSSSKTFNWEFSIFTICVVFCGRPSTNSWLIFISKRLQFMLSPVDGKCCMEDSSFTEKKFKIYKLILIIIS